MAKPRTVSILAVVLLALAVTPALPPTHAGAASQVITTLSFSGHEDDDLLFMNPDIASDVQAGYNVWVVYLTAGDIPYRPGKSYGGMEYANMRIEGERAAYARAAGVPNVWTFQQMTFAGHPVATNYLNGTNVHLVFTFIHAAAGPEDNCGDLYRMLQDWNYVAQPIDGRPSYNRITFISMLSALIGYVQPDYVRTQSTIGHRDPIVDHVDHVAGAILAADADVDGLNNTSVSRYEYTGYDSTEYPETISGYWLGEKTDIWNQYIPHDPELVPGAWGAMMTRQVIRPGRIFAPGVPWIPPGDFTCS